MPGEVPGIAACGGPVFQPGSLQYHGSPCGARCVARSGRADVRTQKHRPLIYHARRGNVNKPSGMEIVSFGRPSPGRIAGSKVKRNQPLVVRLWWLRVPECWRRSVGRSTLNAAPKISHLLFFISHTYLLSYFGKRKRRGLDAPRRFCSYSVQYGYCPFFLFGI